MNAHAQNQSSQSSKAKQESPLKKRSYSLALGVVRYMGSFNHDFSSRILANQLLKSSAEVGLNLMEAKSSPSRESFKASLGHALRSANESGQWLCLLRDAYQIKDKELEGLLEETAALGAMLAKSIITLSENQTKKGRAAYSEKNSSTTI